MPNKKRLTVTQVATLKRIKDRGSVFAGNTHPILCALARRGLVTYTPRGSIGIAGDWTLTEEGQKACRFTDNAK